MIKQIEMKSRLRTDLDVAQPVLALTLSVITDAKEPQPEFQVCRLLYEPDQTLAGLGQALSDLSLAVTRWGSRA